MIIFTEIRNTCSACPAQWEGKTGHGQVIYIRFRWGHLYAAIGPTIGDAIEIDPIFEWDDVDGWNGVMSYEELKKLTAGVLSLPDTETV